MLLVNVTMMVAITATMMIMVEAAYFTVLPFASCDKTRTSR